MTVATLPRSSTASGAAYVDLGEGEPVVLIHGVGLRLEAWTPQIEALSASHRVIAVDLPGHGLSRAIDSTADLHRFVQWLVNVLDELHLDRVNLVGHSMGALMAELCAVTVQQRLHRVALISPVHRRNPAATRAVHARASDISDGKIEPSAPLTRWFPNETTISTAHYLTRQMLEAVNPAAYATAYRAFAAGDDTFAHKWPQVTIPALLVTGELDPNSTPAMSQTMAAAAPNGEVCVIAGHRHMVNLTAAQAVTTALQHWLTREVGVE